MISEIKTKVKQFLTPQVRKNIELSVLFFSTAFSVVSLGLSWITFKDTQQKVDQYVTIADNLRQPYLINFRLAQNGYCNSNETSLFNINWNGTYTGCDCSKASSIDLENIMYKNFCDVTTQYGCTSVYPISQREFQSLAVDSKGKKLALCGERAKSVNQFYKIAANQTGTCKDTQKTCGNPSIPTSVICVSQTDPCPIYQLHFTTAISNLYDSNWGHIQVNDNLHFYFDQLGKNADQLPISQIVSTSGKGPCVFNVYNQTKYADEYLLFIWQREICDQDTNFIKTELALTEKQLYQYNLGDEDYDKVSKFTGYDINNSNENYPIYYKPFIPWAIKNRDLLYPLVDFLLNAQNLLDAILSTLIVSAASVVYLGFFCNGQHIYLLVIKKYEIDSEIVVKLKRYKLVLSFIFKIAALVVKYQFIYYGLNFKNIFQKKVSVNAFNLSSKYKNSLEEIGSEKPTLEVYMESFNSLADFTSKYIYKNNLINIIMTSANMLVDIVSVILELMEYRSKRQEQKVGPAYLDQQTKEIASLKHIEDQQSQINQVNNKVQYSQVVTSKMRLNSNFPQTVIDNSGQKIIFLTSKKLVFQNGMLQTLKELPQIDNNIDL